MTNHSVLVTGGLGYIGSHCVIELLNQNYLVEIIDNLSNSSIESLNRIEKISSKKVKFYQEDLLNVNKIEEIFKNQTYETVIHFAGLKAVGESVKMPLKYYNNNLISTLNLLELCDKYKVKNFIFSSSACVYGETEEGIFSEDFKDLSPKNPYGKTKLMQEQILEDFTKANDNIKIISLRYFNPAGAHESGLLGENPLGIPNNLFPIINNVILGKAEKLKVFGNDYQTHDGTPIRDYIHVKDLAIGHVSAIQFLEKSNKGYYVFNLGVGKGFSVLDVINTYQEVIGKEIKFEFANRRPGDAMKAVSCSDKAFKELGWKAEKTLKDMCQDSFRWITLNPNGLN